MVTISLYDGDKWIGDTDESGSREAVAKGRFCGRNVTHSEYGTRGAAGLRVVVRLPDGLIFEAVLACDCDSDVSKLDALQWAVTMPSDTVRGLIEEMPFAGFYEPQGGKRFTRASISYFGHEEGKIREYPPNLPVILGGAVMDVIVGPIVAVGADRRGDSISLTDEQVEFVKANLSRRSVNAA